MRVSNELSQSGLVSNSQHVLSCSGSEVDFIFDWWATTGSKGDRAAVNVLFSQARTTASARFS